MSAFVPKKTLLNCPTCLLLYVRTDLMLIINNLQSLSTRFIMDTIIVYLCYCLFLSLVCWYFIIVVIKLTITISTIIVATKFHLSVRLQEYWSGLWPFDLQYFGCPYYPLLTLIVPIHQMPFLWHDNFHTIEN